MRVVDANVLIYATNQDAEHHDASASWLDRALAGADTVGLTWLALLAYVRICTNGRLFPHPASPADALDQVARWLSAPGARLLSPGASHVHVLAPLLTSIGTGGNLVSDVHLAAVAIEHRADVVTYDNDFDRFPGVRWYRPDELS